nr:MAG TPA: hypothetical protein [Caudoviricetes sp.]
MSFNRFAAFKVKADTVRASRQKSTRRIAWKPVEKHTPNNADFTKWPGAARAPQRR